MSTPRENTAIAVVVVLPGMCVRAKCKNAKINTFDDIVNA